ncbi:MAG: hypothetical protein UT48_C0017G0011 [Parcubacteria group bacterium GW2011_GWE2_39_37]|uniref:Uncharacterized protein n=1 Tax=Candidatus Falkowbacteria bacterium GW2011_GWF2_39_8 TaxID=1618642 RepID=A0A0G0PX02_9BACT|nr:MAG: hypothetical protein UT48_C0017G0011 [Parcubacteria group bacterium GW2011_GWE2_39_37]KKR32453.1 MAG: hypothetical protein UT64_C0034G0009 [Candidatus Falkowbacteria bacterium GW2011_GWF2_39_8]
MKYDKIDLEQKISDMGEYEIPSLATHIRLFAGKVSFGISDRHGDLKTARGKFFQIPPGMKRVSFPEYINDGNHIYGRPQFTR